MRKKRESECVREENEREREREKERERARDEEWHSLETLYSNGSYS